MIFSPSEVKACTSNQVVGISITVRVRVGFAGIGTGSVALRGRFTGDDICELKNSMSAIIPKLQAGSDQGSGRSWIIVDVHTSPGGAPSMKEDASSTVEAMTENTIEILNIEQEIQARLKTLSNTGA